MLRANYGPTKHSRAILSGACQAFVVHSNGFRVRLLIGGARSLLLSFASCRTSRFGIGMCGANRQPDRPARKGFCRLWVRRAPEVTLRL
jgi:hypothetical protein